MTLKQLVYILLLLIWCTLCTHGCPISCDCKTLQWNSITVVCNGGNIPTIVQQLPIGTSLLEITNTNSNGLSQTEFESISVPQIQTLIIRSSYLNQVDNDAFSVFKGLRTLNLTKDNIRIVSKNAFLKLTYLEKLDLSNNNIQEISEVLSPLTNLRELDISYNSIATIAPNSFKSQGYLSKLKLDGNGLQSLSGGTYPFQGLTSIRSLSMRKCGLSTLNSDLLTSIQSVDTLDIGENSIFSLPSAQDFRTRLPYLRTLLVDHNELSLLSSEQFAGMMLFTLDLSHNKLTKIPNLIFKDSNIQILDLSHNAIVQIESEAFQPLAPRLSMLSLAFNPFRVLHKNTFSNLYRLQSLNLTTCTLQELVPEQFKTLIYLQTLDLSKNRLPYIPQGVLDFPNSGLQFIFYGNPWHCDCQIRPFKVWLQTKWSNMFCTQPNSLACQSPQCQSPSSLSSQEISSLSDSMITDCDTETQESSLPAGVIIGIVFGCLLVLLIIAMLVFICIRKRKKPGFRLCKGPPSDATSHEADKENRSTKPLALPFTDGDQESLQGSDKSFVVRHYFQTMVSTDPSVVSYNPPERMRRDTFRTNYSGSNPSLASSVYSYPMGRETAI